MYMSPTLSPEVTLGHTGQLVCPSPVLGFWEKLERRDCGVAGFHQYWEGRGYLSTYVLYWSHWICAVVSHWCNPRLVCGEWATGCCAPDPCEVGGPDTVGAKERAQVTVAGQELCVHCAGDSPRGIIQLDQGGVRPAASVAFSTLIGFD